MRLVAIRKAVEEWKAKKLKEGEGKEVEEEDEEENIYAVEADVRFCLFGLLFMIMALFFSRMKSKNDRLSMGLSRGLLLTFPYQHNKKWSRRC